MKEAHQIQTLKFDLRIPSVGQNRDIQNRIVHIFNTQYSAMLNELFDRYGKDNDILLENVTLTLSPILLDNFEKSLIRESREQLTIFFENYIKHEKIIPAAPIEAINSEDQPLHPLLYYLVHGVYPWNATDIKPFHIAWDALLKNTDLPLLLRTVVWNQKTIERLVYQLPEAIVTKTLNILAPTQSDLLVSYQEQFALLFSHKKVQKKLLKTPLKQAYWQTVFSLLLEQKSTKISFHQLFKDYWSRLATSSGLKFADIESQMINLAKTRDFKKGYHADFQQLIDEVLFSDNLVNGRSNRDDHSIKDRSLIESLLIMPNKTGDEIQQLKTWLLKPTNKKTIHFHWIEPLRFDLLKSTLQILVPKNAFFIEQYHQSLWSYHKNEEVAVSLSSFQKTVWTFTIDYLLSSFSSIFQRKEFVFSHTARLAAHYNLEHSKFLQSLLVCIQQFPEAGVKYHELLHILMLVSEDQIGLDLVDKSLKNLKMETLSLLEVQSILVSSKYSIHQVVLLKNWLQKKKHRSLIQQHWISPMREDILHKIIEIIEPDNHLFIRQYVATTTTLFHLGYVKEHSQLTVKKAIYTVLFDYLLAHSSTRFNKKMFVKQQLKKVAAHFNLSFQQVFELLLEAMALQKEQHIHPIEFFTILHEIQDDIEATKTRQKSAIKIDEMRLSNIFDLYTTGRFSAINKALIKKGEFQFFLMQLVEYQSKRWFNFIQKQQKPFRIHDSTFSYLTPSDLLIIQLFERQVNQWNALQKKAKKIFKIPLTDKVITLLFYLKTGTIPLWARKQFSLQKAILKIDGLKKAAPFIMLFSKELSFVARWNKSIGKSDKLKILQHLLSGRASFLVRFYKNIQLIYAELQVTQKPASVQLFEQAFWHVLFLAFQKNRSLDSSKFMEAFLQLWEQTYHINFLENKTMMGVVSDKVQENITAPKNNISSIPRSPVTHFDRTPRQEQLTKWYVEFAGLIITYPLLAHLFKIVGYVNENQQFKSEKNQWRAVYLLHYIASGNNDQVPENELVISKVLCGLPIEEPIPNQILLNEEELNVADELLEVLINRWEKLGQTSKDGLRNTFIKRKGLLEEKDQALQLTVETSGTDVLLDFLPWSISIIRLPWLSQIIYVSWR